MNGFLVLLSHEMDDLPIALFDNREQAIRAANTWIEPDGMPMPTFRKVFQTDCSTPVCVKLVTFAEGLPIECEVIKSYTD